MGKIGGKKPRALWRMEPQWFYHRIGWWENVNRKPLYLMVKTMVSGLDFPPLNQYRAVTLYMGKRGGKKPRDIIVRINWWPPTSCPYLYPNTVGIETTIWPRKPVLINQLWCTCAVLVVVIKYSSWFISPLNHEFCQTTSISMKSPKIVSGSIPTMWCSHKFVCRYPTQLDQGRTKISHRDGDNFAHHDRAPHNRFISYPLVNIQKAIENGYL